jgi:hypothetical protein
MMRKVSGDEFRYGGSLLDSRLPQTRHGRTRFEILFDDGQNPSLGVSNTLMKFSHFSLQTVQPQILDLQNGIQRRFRVGHDGGNGQLLRKPFITDLGDMVEWFVLKT